MSAKGETSQVISREGNVFP